MSDPYRDALLACPGCQAPLRVFDRRLCCDACDGIFLDPEDLQQSLTELTQNETIVGFVADRPGQRLCPRCPTAMVRCKLAVLVAGAKAAPAPELDRCATHGIWFDHLELSRVFEAVHGAVSRRSYGSGKPMKVGRDKL